MAATVLNLAATGLATACDDDNSITAPLTGEQQSAQIAATVRNDAHILAVTHVSNLGEISAGNVALTKGSDAAVKQFAAQMIADHTNVDAQGNAIATSLGASLTPPDNTLPTIVAAESDTLNAATAGTTFDRVYIAQQVRAHIRTLGLVDASIPLAQNAQLKALLQNTVRPGVAMHLQMAQTIQARIGTP